MGAALVLLVVAGGLWWVPQPAGAAVARAAGLPSMTAAGWTGGSERGQEMRATEGISYSVFLPISSGGVACPAISNEVYGTVAVIPPATPPVTNPPAEYSPEKNLGIRGYVTTTATLSLVTLVEDHVDLHAPQLAGLFTPTRVPTFTQAYRVNDWNWNCNCRGAPLSEYEVTLLGMQTTPGEIIRVPGSGYDIGWMYTGFEVMVLYASPQRITLKYTREDDVVTGYTIHLENVCVEPRLLALYYQMNDAGRVRLPAVYAGQGIARAAGTEIGVAIRDTGTFLDPRSHLDWWQGQ